MKLLTVIAILLSICTPARAATVYTSFCLSCAIGSQRLLFSNQTPDGFTLTGITGWTGHEVSVTSDGNDLLQTNGGWSAIRPVENGFSEASFTINGAGFRELMLWIGVSDDVPLTISVNGVENLGPFMLHDYGLNFIGLQVPRDSLMTVVRLSVPGDYFTSFNLIRIGGIHDLDLSGDTSPEPGSLTLMVSGLAALCFVRRRAKLRFRAVADG
jgi:hypothetical protein